MKQSRVEDLQRIDSASIGIAKLIETLQTFSGINVVLNAKIFI